MGKIFRNSASTLLFGMMFPGLAEVYIALLSVLLLRQRYSLLQVVALLLVLLAATWACLGLPFNTCSYSWKLTIAGSQRKVAFQPQILSFYTTKFINILLYIYTII